jgi:hypothetical protein
VGRWFGKGKASKKLKPGTHKPTGGLGLFDDEEF